MTVAILVIQCFLLFFIMATYGAIAKISSLLEHLVKAYMENLESLRMSVEGHNRRGSWPDRENL